MSHIVYERLLCLRENSLVWMRSQYLLQKACDRPRWMCIDLCSLDVLDAACSALIRCARCSMQPLLFFDADKHNLRVQYDNAYREAMHGRRVMLVDKR